jgi:ribosome-binding ATPase
MERFGLVGLPNAGKSSLYNALTGGGALAAPYAFATKDPNIGVARVPDERIEQLSTMSKSKKTIHATVEVVDIGGLVEGASKGEGLGNKFLANIREVDAIVFVLRAFEDDDVPGPSDPLEHLRVVELELALADLETVEKRLNQATRQSKLDKSLGDEVAALQAAYDALSEGTPLYRAGLKADHREALAPYFLLTNRRVLAVVNVGEDELDRIPAVEQIVRDEFTTAGDNVEVIGMCVQLEAEAAAITDPVERAEMLEGFGLGEGALFRMVRSAYHLLGLRTYFTTGEKETRAWTFYEGSTAPVCAGRIHSDFQRGFIRAEVIHWDELLQLGSWHAAKEAGKLRVEGKDYVAHDGDVMERLPGTASTVRFNVALGVDESAVDDACSRLKSQLRLGSKVNPRPLQRVVGARRRLTAVRS